MGTVQTADVLVLPDGRMDPKNASTYCGLSVKTLAMKRCNGTGPKFVKLGRIFYFREDLDAWLQRGRVVSTAQAQRVALANEAFPPSVSEAAAPPPTTKAPKAARLVLA